MATLKKLLKRCCGLLTSDGRACYNGENLRKEVLTQLVSAMGLSAPAFQPDAGRWLAGKATRRAGPEPPTGAETTRRRRTFLDGEARRAPCKKSERATGAGTSPCARATQLYKMPHFEQRNPRKTATGGFLPKKSLRKMFLFCKRSGRAPRLGGAWALSG